MTPRAGPASSPGPIALVAAGCGTAVASVCAVALFEIQRTLAGLWSVAAVLVAGLACGVLARTFGRLCQVVPSGVGVPAYLSRAFGRRLGLGLTLPYLVLMVALAGVEARIVGSLLGPLLGIGEWPVALGFLVVTWGICRMGLRPGYRSQIIATAALMLLLAGLAAQALVAATREGRWSRIALAAPPSAMAFLAGVGQAFFLFMGFELITSHVEVAGSPRPIAVALRRCATILTLFYALVAAGFSASRFASLDPGAPAPWLTPQLAMATSAGGMAAGSVLVLVVTAACLLASFTSFNGALLALSRLVHAFAVQGVLPRSLARLDATRLVPGRALGLLLAATIAATALVFAGGRAFTLLVLGGAAAAAGLVYAGALWAREGPPYREAQRAPLARPLAAGLAVALLVVGSGALVGAALAAADSLRLAREPREVAHGH